ncbi:MAG TPA: hemerythrin family protein [Rhodospirillaceae bacterium]|nr:hemerythrin family protein [Rhodospirillaceae bacterium]
MLSQILSSNIELGHTVIDAQHRYLIEIGKKIEALSAERKSTKSISLLLKKYRRITKKHFSSEEEYMALLVDDAYKPHKIAHSHNHKYFINFLNDVIKDISVEDDFNCISDLMSYLFNGFKLHMLYYDKELFAFLKKEKLFNAR